MNVFTLLKYLEKDVLLEILRRSSDTHLCSYLENDDMEYLEAYERVQQHYDVETIENGNLCVRIPTVCNKLGFYPTQDELLKIGKRIMQAYNGVIPPRKIEKINIMAFGKSIQINRYLRSDYDIMAREINNYYETK
jgi:hypothetical protein